MPIATDTLLIADSPTVQEAEDLDLSFPLLSGTMNPFRLPQRQPRLRPPLLSRDLRNKKRP